MPVALHALHTQQWTADQQKAPPHLPAPPSPTLTNPDNILPSGSGRDYTATAARSGFGRRPPSPSYLREGNSSGSSLAGAHAGDRDMTMSINTGRKEKMGLMSRKMMLLRSRTASNGSLRDAGRDRNASHWSIDSDLTLPPSPVLRDVGNLAPEQQPPQLEQLQLPEQESRRKSGSSSGLSGMADFLAKYAKPEGTGSDDETVDDNAPQFESSEVDAQRRKQELEEYNSAVLSKRAEQILANAKKRLNVMEGNLRGARDLVAPLTAANLKRATSLGSAQHSHYSPGGGASSYNSRVRYIPQQQHYGDYDRDADRDQPAPYRTLHSQASTPAMGRQYQHAHARNFSEIELPDRPFTSLDHHRSGSLVRPHSRTRVSESPSNATGLRTSRSYDSLGMSGRERPLHNRTSPDSNHLEALPEGDEAVRDEASRRDAVRQRYHHQVSLSQDTNNGLGIYRSSSRASSRTSDLREQMSSLKGKISTLKERAREDSLRRQSHANLRSTETTPFNNAESAAPEFFYNPGVAKVNGPDTEEAQEVHTPDSWPVSGSRNAFAEQAASTQNHHIQCARVVEIVAGSAPQRRLTVREVRTTPSPPQKPGRKRSGTTVETGHKRTPSGTAIVSAAEKRYSHHQLSSAQSSMPGTFLDDRDVEDILAAPPSPHMTNAGFASSPLLPAASNDDYYSKTDASIDDDYAPSESDAAESVYEDAPEYEGEAVVPHEHREDAFDYENFFLSGAMARYNAQRRASGSSTGSMSSTETAKGPVAPPEDGDVDDGYSSDPGVRGIFPPPTPQTPERLRAIERDFAQRQMAIRPLSEESVSTNNTFATATEGSESSDEGSGEVVTSPPVSPISESLHRFSGHLLNRPVSPLTDAGGDDTAASQAVPLKSSPSVGGYAVGGSDFHDVHNGSSPLFKRIDSPSTNGDTRPGAVVRLRRSSSSDRADSGVEIKSSAHKPQQASLSRQYGPPSRDHTAVAVNALLDPNGVGLGLRDNAVLFSVIESLRNVVRELQRPEAEGDGKAEMSREMRMLMMRRRLERARGALDGGFGA